MFKRMKVCFGTEFFGDVGIVEYDGNHYRNKRNRYRWLCDNKNELIYEWEWLNDNLLDSMNEIFNENSIHFGIEELIIRIWL